MAYTDIDKPSDYFNTVLYTGNNTDNTSITGVGFQPDWVWLKARNQADYHYSMDSVRGALKPLFQNDTSAEANFSDSLKSFNTDGFTLGTSGDLNAASQTMVAWNWKAGTSFTNDASATGIGTIDSTGSVNTDAGFSIVTWSGSGATGTIAHGLGTEPSVIIPKCRTQTAAWYSYWKPLGNGNAVRLNTTNASASTGIWNNTSPTSSVFSVINNTVVNQSGHTYVAYCFAEKQGYSKFGSYTGNGNNDGTFVYTGFKPAFVIAKNSGASEGWSLFDNKRSTSGANIIDDFLVPSSSEAEISQNICDFVSNGFKFRHVDGKYHNSGGSYIYMAFAENPFVTSTGVPATAR